MSFMAPRRPARAGQLLDHPDQRAHPPAHPRCAAPQPAVFRQIEGIGPRYCPSIEDKVVRFAEKASHQIFLEPEAGPHRLSERHLHQLPFDVQLELVRSIRGFEQAHHPPWLRDRIRLLRSARAEPRWKPRRWPGCSSPARSTAPPATRRRQQGLLAGSTPRLRARSEDAWWLRRDEAYLGVLVDDLITTAPASRTACSPAAPDTGCARGQ